MKKIVLLLVLLFGGAFASNNNALGVFWCGYDCGGLDYKRLMGSSNVLDVYFGGTELGSKQTHINLDGGYYFLFNVIKADPSVGTFPLHVGPNAGFHFMNMSNKASGGSGGSDRLDLGAGVAGGISWFMPTTPKMDLSFELTSPAFIRLDTYQHAGDSREWGIKFFDGSIGFRLLFHVYFF